MGDFSFEHQARIQLTAAIAKGIIKPARYCPCANCGVNREIYPKCILHWHHPDYNKPLEVICLCFYCHKALHSRLQREIRGEHAAQEKIYLHKGRFVGGYVGDEQFAKVVRIEKYLAGIFGESDVNRSKVLRYIIENFNEGTLPRLSVIVEAEGSARQDERVPA